MRLWVVRCVLWCLVMTPSLWGSVPTGSFSMSRWWEREQSGLALRLGPLLLSRSVGGRFTDFTDAGEMAGCNGFHLSPNWFWMVRCWRSGPALVLLIWVEDEIKSFFIVVLVCLFLWRDIFLAGASRLWPACWGSLTIRLPTWRFPTFNQSIMIRLLGRSETSSR